MSSTSWLAAAAIAWVRNARFSIISSTRRVRIARPGINTTRWISCVSISDLQTRSGFKVLGLTPFDLFIPILTFVFGQAQLNNRNALMSFYRLSQTYYGLPEDEDLFLTRCEKEALHELGHTFGLVHCRNFECVMYLSNAIEQVDLKMSAFCDACRGQLDGVLGSQNQSDRLPSRFRCGIQIIE